MESPKTDSYVHSQLVVKGKKVVQWRKDNPFNKQGQNNQMFIQKKNVHPSHHILKLIKLIQNEL